LATDIIKLLPDNIANQIAAGEVIQRPASAVKELLENAIDAKANKIQLIIKDAGKTLIQVIDNGFGMSPTDARMSFERHATSKIKHSDDLFNLSTKGFRGEALASIAAIAQVELKTKRKEDETASLIVIEGAEFKKQSLCQSNDGTNFSIKNLFYNVPARRNFLKTNAVELRHIILEFTRIALAHPQISFTFYNNGLEIFHLTNGGLKQRIIQLLQSKNLDENIIPLFEEKDFVKIEHPFYAIFITIDPKRIDVNVHPTKQEIKFDDEKIIYHFIHSGVRHSLGKYSDTPTLDFEQSAAFNFHPKSSAQSIKNLTDKFSGGSFIGKNETSSKTSKHSGEVRAWEDMYQISKDLESEEDQKMDTITVKSKFNTENLNASNDEIQLFDNITFEPIQLHKKYILTQIKSGIMLIDQRAAHVRILFEKFIVALAKGKAVVQQSLYPKKITLNLSDAQIFKSILNDVNQLGFDIKEFGENDFVVHGKPLELEKADDQQLIESFVEDVKQSNTVKDTQLKQKMAKTLACQAAIKSGKILSKKEMNSIIDELFACEIPYISPVGTLCFVTFGLDDLEQQFMQNLK